ncbi:hypothetical protein [Oscillibacter sp.]|uniref:hypothetical protein n=1 Tax=Oscillibacter sp. TaxID=1945593 RepID=UPI00289B1DA1|nr:hypothetical protein [Oscillibacter sp.]
MKLIKPAAVDSFGSGLDKKIDILYSGLRPLLRTFIDYQKLFKGTLKAFLRPGYGLRPMRKRSLNDSLCKVVDERMEQMESANSHRPWCQPGDAKAAIKKPAAEGMPQSPEKSIGFLGYAHNLFATCSICL